MMVSGTCPATSCAKASWPRNYSLRGSGVLLKTVLSLVFAALLAAISIGLYGRTQKSEPTANSHLGFDLNAYPGDEALPLLRKTFSFAGYWLSAPPGEKNSSWTGKRKAIQQQGFGFLVLFNARASREVKNTETARAKGKLDAQSAATLAKQEGFPAGTVIFLDVEEGGRLSESYQTYVQSWFESLATNGFHSGVYCSGMPVNEGHGVHITTAQDIQAHAGSKKIVFWVYNDACPPSPGCGFPKNPSSPAVSGTDFATIWQYAQTPMRKQFASHCPASYAPDGNCYAPGDQQHKWFLDANVASTPDPSAAK
jgi:hypothetical protein